MWVFHEEEDSFGSRALPFVIGAAGGLALGMLWTRRDAMPGSGRLGEQLRERARGVSRERPGRHHRLVGEQSELTAVEDAVLDAFLQDEILRDRGIDVGAISRGIVELSGSVWTEEEADRAVDVAGRVSGVETVVDRMEIEEESRHLREQQQQRENSADPDSTAGWEGRNVGMGRTRQGEQTEPDRPDDAQKLESRALDEADREQWMEEDFASANPRTSERPEVEEVPDLHYSPDQLDNQDPHRAGNAEVTLDRQPQKLDSAARVGEGAKPGVELRLEQADVPVKPHGGNGEQRDETR